MPLEKDLVTVVTGRASSAQYMVERNFEQRGTRRVGRDVTTDPGVFFVLTHDHRHRIPADDAFNASLDLPIAGIRRLLVGVNRIDVRRVGLVFQFDAFGFGTSFQNGQQIFGSVRPTTADHIFQ